VRFLLGLLASFCVLSPADSAEPANAKVTSLAELGFHWSKSAQKSVCFELLDTDVAALLDAIRTEKNTIAAQSFEHLIRDKKIQITETAQTILVQSNALVHWRNNPLDLEVDGLTFDGDLSTLEGLMIALAAPSRGGRIRMGEDPYFSFKFDGNMKVRQVFMRVAQEAKLCWHLIHRAERVIATPPSETSLELEVADLAQLALFPF
jgi:hypothetical protein